MGWAKRKPRRSRAIARRLQEIYQHMTRSEAQELWDEAATLVETLPEGSRARREVQWLMEAIKEKAKALR